MKRVTECTNRVLILTHLDSPWALIVPWGSTNHSQECGKIKSDAVRLSGLGSHRNWEAQFGPQLGSQPVSELYFAANEIRPSLIRVEADEATYNLHIIIRYDLEKMLIEGTLGVEDLSEAWNARYHQDLGITVEEDRDGVLQDVLECRIIWLFPYLYPLAISLARSFLHLLRLQSMIYIRI